MQYFQNETNVTDNVSDISTEIDHNQFEMLNSNYEEHNSAGTTTHFPETNCLISNQQINNSQIIPSSDVYQHQSPKNMLTSSPSNLRHLIPHTNTTAATDNLSSQLQTSNYSTLANNEKYTLNISNRLNSGHKDNSYDEEDDESYSDAPTSPNMTNYNYYSNIIANINPTNTSIDIAESNKGLNEINILDQCQIFKKDIRDSLTSGTLNSIPNTFNSIQKKKIRSSGNESLLKIDSSNMISNPESILKTSNKDNENFMNTTGNKFISSSTSDLIIKNESNVEEMLQSDKIKQDSLAKNMKKNKGLEWRSTQLSMGNYIFNSSILKLKLIVTPSTFTFFNAIFGLYNFSNLIPNKLIMLRKNRATNLTNISVI